MLGGNVSRMSPRFVALATRWTVMSSAGRVDWTASLALACELCRVRYLCVLLLLPRAAEAAPQTLSSSLCSSLRCLSYCRDSSVQAAGFCLLRVTALQ